MYRMLVLDLDGTLVNKEGIISEPNRTAVRAAEDAGVKVVIASARPYPAVSGVLDQLKLKDPYVIAGSGASVWRAADGSKFFGYLMTPDQVRECAAFAKHYGYEYLAIKDDGNYYTPSFNESASFYGDVFQMKGYLTDFDATDCPDCCKVMIFTEPVPEKVMECMDRMKRELPECGVSKTWVNILEFYPSLEVRKENAMTHLAGLLDIPMKDTLAVGDDIVDIGMIKAAGLGVAMGNASDTVKAEADYVTASNAEDGVAKVIREQILRCAE